MTYLQPYLTSYKKAQYSGAGQQCEFAALSAPWPVATEVLAWNIGRAVISNLMWRSTATYLDAKNSLSDGGEWGHGTAPTAIFSVAYEL